jgi:hypothetical protein
MPIRLPTMPTPSSSRTSHDQSTDQPARSNGKPYQIRTSTARPMPVVTKSPGDFTTGASPTR